MSDFTNPAIVSAESASIKGDDPSLCTEICGIFPFGADRGEPPSKMYFTLT